MEFDFAERTDVGLKRKLNEDSFVSLPDRGLWAVADGMGGHEAGEVASAKVVEALARVPAGPDLDAFVGRAIDALRAVNRELVDLGRQGLEHKTIGSTVVGVAIGEGQFRCFWAGDSRCYRVRDGQITQISRDHSLVQQLVAAGMLDPAEAENHPNASVITRAVGAAEELNVEVTEGEARSGDVFLIASDGLTREVSQIELLSKLLSKPIAEAADAFIQLVLDRGAPDNVTLVVVKVL
ncbi:MAG TPA: protein phosphatase 2C domain-containing protein [Sphingomonadaceae bacterium]